MQKGKIILINGASSAGKSTLAAAVRDQLPEPFLRFSFDLFIDSYALPKVERSEWQRIRPAVFAGYHRCWPALAGAGNNLVIDHIIEEKEWRDDLLDLLTGFDVFCVGLHCSLEELERRELARGDRGAGDARRDLEIVHKYMSYDLELNSEDPLEHNRNSLIKAWQKRSAPSAFNKMAATAFLTPIKGPHMIPISTSRLIFKEAKTTDAPFFLELMNEPGWLKYIAQHNIQSTEKAIEYIETKIMAAYAAHGSGLWLIALKTTGRPIGICGFVNRDQLDHADIGFAFLEAFGGQGYAFEAAEGALSFAKSHLNDANILAIVSPANHRSIRLLEKLGFTLKSDFFYPDSYEKLYLFSIKNS